MRAYTERQNEKYKDNTTDKNQEVYEMDCERIAACGAVCSCLCRHALRCFWH